MGKILIVDDKPEIRDLLKVFLEKKGFSVWSASSGKEAIVFIERDKPALVVLDVKLPDLPGIEVLKKIKKVDPGAKVVMLSGVSSPELEEDAFKHGAVKFLPKSAGIKDLVEEIVKLTG